jgi:GAF domain-containing protein
VADDTTWIARPEWAERERIRSFAGHPLLFRDEVLGVLAVFTRTPLDEDAFAWLRVFADHAAVAITHSRAFEEIRRLSEQLELENTYLREDARAVAGGIVGGSAPQLRGDHRGTKPRSGVTGAMLLPGGLPVLAIA